MSEQSCTPEDFSSSRPKFWEAPATYLIAKPVLCDVELRRFLENNGMGHGETVGPMLDRATGDGLIEFAGRMCYMSYQKGRDGREYFKNILDSGHGSVLEHANFSFAVEGVSRSLTHEAVRHRAGFGFSQLSQRFVDESNVSFVIPPLLLADPVARPTLEAQCQNTRLAYKHMVDRKMNELTAPAIMFDFAVREGYFKISNGSPDTLFEAPDGTAITMYGWIAQLNVGDGDVELRTAVKKATYTARKKTALEACRSILPNCTETKLVMTANVRAWRHFISMRGSVHADREIRRLAVSIAGKLLFECPLAFQDVEIYTAADGLEATRLTYPKV